jgi:hypothetical protein
LRIIAPKRQKKLQKKLKSAKKSKQIKLSSKKLKVSLKKKMILFLNRAKNNKKGSNASSQIKNLLN